MATFVPGWDLAHAFYDEVVGPAVRPTPHAAALVGTGSDVLGYDTARSTDHGWGPRMHVFVGEEEVAGLAASVEAALPPTFRDWPTRYGWDAVPVQSHVVVTSLGDWLTRHLGFDPRRGVGLLDWLAAPQQLLLEVTAGPVFHDDGGELAGVRDRLAWYPDALWRWLVGCQWRRLDQKEPFVGRTAEVGDEIGSRVIAARLVRDLMRLCLLLDRRYAPYTKWLGTAFARLDVAARLGPVLERTLAATNFPDREDALVEAFQVVARHHNEVGLTRPVPTAVGMFHSRPFRVLGSSRFVDACLEAVDDEWLRSLPPVGAVDQFVDSTDVVSYVERARLVASLFA